MIFSPKTQIMVLEGRIQKLLARDPIENMKIVKALKRRIRSLEAMENAGNC